MRVMQATRKEPPGLFFADQIRDDIFRSIVHCCTSEYMQCTTMYYLSSLISMKCLRTSSLNSALNTHSVRVSCPWNDQQTDIIQNALYYAHSDNRPAYSGTVYNARCFPVL